MFAVIQSGGKQYTVKKGQKLEVEKIEAKEGDTVILDRVLLVNNENKVEIGTPLVSGATVKAKVLGQVKADKIVVFKMKPKKRYQKTQGHRQQLTALEIIEITVGGKTTKAKEEKAEAPKKKETEKKAVKTTKPTVKKTTKKKSE